MPGAQAASMTAKAASTAHEVRAYADFGAGDRQRSSRRPRRPAGLDAVTRHARISTLTADVHSAPMERRLIVAVSAANGCNISATTSEIVLAALHRACDRDARTNEKPVPAARYIRTIEALARCGSGDNLPARRICPRVAKLACAWPGVRVAFSRLSSPRRRGPIRRVPPTGRGAWVPGLAALARDDMKEGVATGRESDATLSLPGHRPRFCCAA